MCTIISPLYQKVIGAVWNRYAFYINNCLSWGLPASSRSTTINVEFIDCSYMNMFSYQHVLEILKKSDQNVKESSRENRLGRTVLNKWSNMQQRKDNAECWSFMRSVFCFFEAKRKNACTGKQFFFSKTTEMVTEKKYSSPVLKIIFIATKMS